MNSMTSLFRLLAQALLLAISSLISFAQGPEVVIPVPSGMILSKGTYVFEDEPSVTVRLRKGAASPEGYVLEVSKKGVVITASDEAGVFYARQTLRQMTRDGALHEIRCCTINDAPRFPYRGLHFDVSRHFRSLEFLKKQIDAMAYFKLNRMHIHLTDAAGWRLEIDAYPRLAEFAAWRPETLWKDWWAGDRLYVEEGTPGAYGGYYTKEQMRELVEYAAQRHIEIIPEIEMPGHSEEVLAAYPHLSCSSEPYRQGEFCVGKEATFEFLETVLAEVMDVFPSEYIHIGGDEADRSHWKTCQDCQRRMQEEGLSDVAELQSYLIRRVERFVNSKGRRIIGWDEILDGGLAPDATVMSWRGTQGGIDAMQLDHDVIMTPGRYCYLDHTQDAPFKEPESIGGYLPLELVYNYEPVEESMPKDKLEHLVGIQANLWTEYVPTDSHAEYMYWPRAFAIAETGWSQPSNKSYKSFRNRALLALDLMKDKGYEVFDLAAEYGERKLAQSGIVHKAVGAKVTYNKPINNSYPGAGPGTFTDGQIGGWTYSDGRWQGFLSDIDVVVDLGEVRNISYVGGTFMQLAGPGVFMPSKADVYVSENGVDYVHVAEIWNETPATDPNLLFRSFDTVCDVNARYVRYHAARSTMRGWLFLDEIVIN